MKLLEKIKDFYIEPNDIFFELVKNTLEQISQDDLYKIVHILTGVDENGVKKMKTIDFIGVFIKSIQKNDLVACYHIAKELGIFNR